MVRKQNRALESALTLGMGSWVGPPRNNLGPQLPLRGQRGNGGLLGAEVGTGSPGGGVVLGSVGGASAYGCRAWGVWGGA